MDAGLGQKFRSVRKAKQISIKVLAERTGLTSSLISQFERGVAGISLHSLQKLTNAVGVGMNELFTPVDLKIVRRSERVTILRPGGVPLSMVSPEFYRSRVVECRLSAGESSSEGFQHHDGKECAVVITGTVRVQLGQDECLLDTGDSITFNGHTPHRYTNLGNREAVLIMVLSPVE